MYMGHGHFALVGLWPFEVHEIRVLCAVEQSIGYLFLQWGRHHRFDNHWQALWFEMDLRKSTGA
jgi:hypothetical protein